jgi:hypothetical protein
MTRSITFSRLVVAAVLAAAVALPLAAPALAGPPPPPVPGDIAVPDGNKVFLVGHAVGVQIYSCTGTAWTLVAPRADLFGDNGKLIATHFAGPTWQANDGSKVVGSRRAGVTVDPTAIPRLLLAAASTAPGEGDRLAETTYIQRIDTTGGLAPAGACTAGATAEVPYTADYVFWKPTGASPG